MPDAGDQPRAIILLIGDGMGEKQRTAARWQAVGQDGQLAMDAMPVSGWSRTGSADSFVTDSAATAMAMGVKTNKWHDLDRPIQQHTDALVNANTLVIVTGDHETGGMSVSLSPNFVWG